MSPEPLHNVVSLGLLVFACLCFTSAQSSPYKLVSSSKHLSSQPFPSSQHVQDEAIIDVHEAAQLYDHVLRGLLNAQHPLTADRANLARIREEARRAKAARGLES